MAIFDLFKKKRQVPPGTAYIIWSCLEDKSSCENCKTFEGICWIPDVSKISEPPYLHCTSQSGCRCVGVYVSDKEQGAKEAGAYIKKLGGSATKEQMKQYHEQNRGLVDIK